MEPINEKQFNTKSTYDTFDEIYTNYDLSVDKVYTASSGYPFDYPIRWLNDPSMNKRIAIRRLDATPSSHSFTLCIQAEVNDKLSTDENASGEQYFEKQIVVDITYQDTLIKVMNFICNQFMYENDDGVGGLLYNYDTKNNKLILHFIDSSQDYCNFKLYATASNDGSYFPLDEFLMFLNQETTGPNRHILTSYSDKKEFNEVWDRNRLHFHSSFSTSRRHFMGKRGDFYQNLTLLYPPSNETTFNVRFTTDGYKNILLRYTDFEIQLCFIVNYQKNNVL